MTHFNLAKPPSIYAMEYTVPSYHAHPQSEELSFRWLIEYLLNTSSTHGIEIFRYLSEQGIEVPSEDNHWIMTLTEVDIQRNPKVGQTIRVETRVVRSRPFMVNRYYQVFLDDEPIAEAYTQFMMIDIKNRSVVRLNAKDFTEAGYEDSSVFRRFTRLRLPNNVERLSRQNYDIQSEDIDYNDHVNNIRYVKWAVDQIDAERLDQMILTQAKVKYGQEMLEEHQAQIDTYLIDETEDTFTTFHQINNLSTDEEACLLQLTFKRKDD